MDLRNSLEHARGSVVSVNGHDYSIDDHGVARGVADEDARKLLCNADGAWKVIPRREAVQVAQSRDAEVPLVPKVEQPDPIPVTPAPTPGAPVAQPKRGRRRVTATT